ncbi:MULTISPECIES: ATP-binding protein [Roseinatronobacter]|uniref:ATP-binding protein n=1 Tax=Roseinatronobacter domitianus TaxID=2940293 RepID=A0ABT0LYG7_9RHOB|nr:MULTISPECIES: ATP-binding protein [Roseibaca]MCL1627660.1 ATP-binding protein [Roseibaca domitiana]
MIQSDPTPLPVLTTCCNSSLNDVRALLVQVDKFLHAQGTPAEWVEDMNIILAEVLSNIARHGYSDMSGRIDLEIRLGMNELRCRVSDKGRPFDPKLIGHRAPEPTRLREGGYGWFLIRSLARALTYHRVKDTNCLTFWVPVGHKLPIAALAD